MITKKGNNPITSVFWSILERYLPSIIQIISTLIIARLIGPKDFGELAIISTIIQIATLLVASGFAEALIYRRNNSQILYSSVFYFNFFISLLLYILFFGISKGLAEFYHMERLSILIKIAGINLLVYPFTYIQRVLFSLNLNFKTPGLITFFSSVTGCSLGIYLAFNGFGVWALVYQTLTLNFMQALLFWLLSSWRPSIGFSKKELFSIMPYSSKILFNNFIQTAFDNIYALVIGKYYSASILGYYNRMQTVVYFTTTNFMYALESVFFPTITKKKAEEGAEFLPQSYEMLIRLSTFFTFPILVIILALAKPIILVLLTEKWVGGLPILRFLAFAYLFIPVIYINNSFLKIINKPNILFYSGIVKKTIGIVILIITINYDIIVVCYGILIYYFIDAIISMILTQKLMKIGIGAQTYFLSANIIANLLLYFIITYASLMMSNNLLKIIVGVSCGMLFYLILNLLWKSKEYQLLKRIILKR